MSDEHFCVQHKLVLASSGEVDVSLTIIQDE